MQPIKPFAAYVNSLKKWYGLKPSQKSGDEGWIKVKSSWIDAWRYNPKTKTLDIRHKSGKVYPNYPGMTYYLLHTLIQASSVGKWIWKHYPPSGKKLHK